MKRNKTAGRTIPSKNTHNPHPRSTSYYLYFTKASKKAGALATEAYFQVIDFFSRDIPLPQKKDFSDALSSIIPKRLADTDNEVQPPKTDINAIVKKSNEVLAEATTVFPITLFPDTVVLDRTKLTITIRTFFMTSRTMSIRIEDVLNVSTSVGPLFGSLTIAIRGLTSEDHFVINYFWRKDAVHIKHMIQGYIIALHDKIDIRNLSKEQLITTLAELGHDSNP